MSREVIIIGGGISGLMLAFCLSKDKYRPVVIEKEEEIGGLSSTFKADNFLIERHYHYFLSRDAHIVRLFEEMGLGSEIIWKKVKVGLLSIDGLEFLAYLSGQGLRSCSCGWDFFIRRDLNVSDKCALARLYLKILSLRDLRDIENIPAKDWFTKQGSSRVFEKIFEPILMAKWGRIRGDISASWLVARLGARFDFAGWFKPNEYAGYPRRSFQSLFSRLEEKINENGGKIVKKAQVREIKSKEGRVEEVVYIRDGQASSITTDCVINTAPLPVLMNIANFQGQSREKYDKVKYQHAICVCLGLKESLSKALNVVCLPNLTLFNGIVEHTNIAPKELYNNQAIVYLFKYLDNKGEEWDWSDKEIIDKWTEELGILFPAFKKNGLLWAKVSKAEFGDPVSILGYSQIMPQLFTSIKGLFLTGLCRDLYVQDCNNLINLVQKDLFEIKNYLRNNG